ncbi:hypothetical protein AC229_0727 [Oenococcus oeni]|nr:hypothetical protein AC229_0727 [Oenococcus oeni]
MLKLIESDRTISFIFNGIVMFFVGITSLIKYPHYLHR